MIDPKLLRRIGYLTGYIQAVTDLATVIDNEMVVGQLQMPLKEAVAPHMKELQGIHAEIDVELGEMEKEFTKKEGTHG